LQLANAQRGQVNSCTDMEPSRRNQAMRAANRSVCSRHFRQCPARPSSWVCGVYQGIQGARKLAAGDRFRPQAGQMFRFLLAVNQPNPNGTQDGYQRHKCHLRRIGLKGKHGFAEEHAAKEQTVQAANQFPVRPRLDRVRVTKTKKVDVSPDHLRSNPSAELAVSWGASTGLNDTGECRICPNVEPPLFDPFSQRARDPKVFDLEHHAGVGAPPQNGLTRAVPRKNAAPICS